jgi:uncharacterized protein (TIGR03067 family)
LTLAAGDGKKELVDMEYAKLEGTWQVVSLEVDGMKIPKETIKESKLIIKGKGFTMKERSPPTGARFSSTPARSRRRSTSSSRRDPKKETPPSASTNSMATTSNCASA